MCQVTLDEENSNDDTKITIRALTLHSDQSCVRLHG